MSCPVSQPSFFLSLRCQCSRRFVVVVVGFVVNSRARRRRNLPSTSLVRVFDVFWAIVSTISLIPSFSVCRGWQTLCDLRVRVFSSVFASPRAHGQTQCPTRSCIPVSSQLRDFSSLYANTRHSSLHTLAIPTEIVLTRSRLPLFLSRSFPLRVLVSPFTFVFAYSSSRFLSPIYVFSSCFPLHLRSIPRSLRLRRRVPVCPCALHQRSVFASLRGIQGNLPACDASQHHSTSKTRERTRT